MVAYSYAVVQKDTIFGLSHIRLVAIEVRMMLLTNVNRQITLICEIFTFFLFDLGFWNSSNRALLEYETVLVLPWLSKANKSTDLMLVRSARKSISVL